MIFIIEPNGSSVILSTVRRGSFYETPFGILQRRELRLGHHWPRGSWMVEKRGGPLLSDGVAAIPGQPIFT